MSGLSSNRYYGTVSLTSDQEEPTTLRIPFSFTKRSILAVHFDPELDVITNTEQLTVYDSDGSPVWVSAQVYFATPRSSS